MARPEVTGRRSGRRLLTFADLKARGIPWTRMHVGRLEAAGKFPQHIDLGENSIAWFEDEIDDFLEEKAAKRDARAEAETSSAMK
jgi:prophage regulatory protein